MGAPIATGALRSRIMLGAILVGIFFGLMPPYVMMIVVVATWGMPPIEPPDEQTFRAVYLLRLVIGNFIGLGVGAFLTAGAVHLGLRYGGRATYARAIVGGGLMGPIVGGFTAASTSMVLLISSTNTEWAWRMAQRAFACGAMMGLVNGIAAALVIVWFIRRSDAGLTPSSAPA
jgi:MFS family permease